MYGLSFAGKLELQEREKKKNSIMIRELQYGEDFQDKFSSVVSFYPLCPDRTAPVTLTDVVPISSLLVRAKIPNLNVSQELLSRSNKLSRSHLYNIYISRDLTYVQREELGKKLASAGQPKKPSLLTLASNLPTTSSSLSAAVSLFSNT